MNDNFYECIVTTTRQCVVRVPVDDPQIVRPGEDPAEVALEFAGGGQRAWPDYVIEDGDEETEVYVREIAPPHKKEASDEPQPIPGP